MLPTSADYREIFLSGAPLLDTRAPVEFARGSFPSATSLPLMTDDERAEVGTCYKTHGQDAAIALGHRLVSGPRREARISAWADFAKAHPEGYLYCFRGGLRSQTVQQWLAEEAGIEYPRILGGYKAMRHFLMETMEVALTNMSLTVLGGMTGTGKTAFLEKLPNALDLEGCANHRGSSFGKRVSGQPAQIDFEHRLALRLLQLEAAGREKLIVEDEGHFIGSCSIPDLMFSAMTQAPILWLEDQFETRATRILQDYVISQLSDYCAVYGPEIGFENFYQHLLKSLGNIQKRLGGERYQRALTLMQQALKTQAECGDVDGHRAWIELLLREYYDPMYVHQKARKSSRIIASGDADYLAKFVTKP
jgi:tRNA 2-selenouridine synthase